MANSGSVVVSRELRIHNGLRSSQSYNNVLRKNRTHIVTMNLTSHGLVSFIVFDVENFLFDPQRQNPSTLQMFRRGPSPASVSSKYNIFLCQSVVVPGGGSGSSVLKSATLVLSRSYGGLCGSLLIIKLIPAIGLIAFAAWGVRPLIRLSRNLFLHTTDSNWNRSDIYYVTTSYIQPVLLWIGATLVCSALDPLVLPSEASQAIKKRLLSFVRSLSTVLAFAYCLSSLIQHAQKFFVETTDSSEARNMGFDFAGKAVYTAVWVAALSLFMELLGFSTQKWLTAGGLGTVLLTLAGREIFTNFLSSVMIHATRPFVLNEWIQTKIEGYEVSGTVEHVGWWSPTIIRGDDREAVHIPNHKFTVNVVRNLSQKTHWRIKSYLAISHFDVNKINNIVADMRKVIAKNPQVEQQRLHRRVFLDYIDPENQALMVLVSCFVKTSHFEEYLCVKEAILLDLLRVISHHRARLATPLRTIQKIYREGDLEEVNLADTIFSRSTAAIDRPLLLIEPLYKINSDDKKSTTRTIRSEDEKDSKQETAPTSNVNTSDKAGLASNPDGKMDDKSTAKSNSHSGQNLKSSQASKLDSQNQNLQLDNATEGPQMPVVKSGVRGKEDDNTEHRANNTTPKLEKPSAVLPESDGEQSDKSSVGLRTKQDSEAAFPASPGISMPPLEENILLGVALEGSKRTLPIEEEMSLPTTLESREISAHRTPLSQISEAKDGQIPTVPNVTKND